MADDTRLPTMHELKAVTYRDVDVLRRFTNQNGRILARTRTNIPAKLQRRVASAIKRARFMGLLPYVNR